jgi:hypothetical protein
MSWFLWYSKDNTMPWVVAEKGSQKPERYMHVKIHCFAETVNDESPIPGFGKVTHTLLIHGTPKIDGDTITFT